MSLLQNSRFARLILFIVAMQLMNMSIEAPTAQMNTTASAGDFNYMDTYVEFIAEVVLQIENAVPEQKHHQHRELQTHGQLQVICHQPEILLLVGWHALPAIPDYPAYTNHYRYQLTREINHPPSFFG